MNKMLKLLFVAFSVSLVLEIHAHTTEVVPTMAPLPLPKKVESLENTMPFYSLSKSHTIK